MVSGIRENLERCVAWRTSEFQEVGSGLLFRMLLRGMVIGGGVCMISSV